MSSLAGRLLLAEHFFLCVYATFPLYRRQGDFCYITWRRAQARYWRRSAADPGVYLCLAPVCATGTALQPADLAPGDIAPAIFYCREG